MCPEEGRQPSSALLLRGTFDPAGLLQLGEVQLEATVLGLCLLGLSVLRSHPCLRLRLRLCLRLCLCLRLRFALRLRLCLRRRLLDLFVNGRLRHRKPQALILRASGGEGRIRVGLITITVFRMCHASGGGDRTRRQDARWCMWQSI